mgnify:FL=1
MKIFLTILFSVFVLVSQGVCAKESLTPEEVFIQDEEIMSMVKNGIFGAEGSVEDLEECLDEFQKLTEEFLQIETDRQKAEAEKRLREMKEGWERIQRAIEESEARYRLR